MSQIQVGIIGTGVISELHLRAYQKINEAEVVALCDLNEEVVQSKTKKWGVQKIYTDFNAMLADPEIQAIEILTPQQSHKEITVAALKAGKHVSVQKPMAVSLAEAIEMLLASKATPKIARVYENFRFYPAIQEAKALIDSGEIGEPLSIRFKLTNGYGGKGDFAHEKSETWDRRMEIDMSGGGAVTFDHGYHIYTLARFFMGEVESVFAWIGRKKDRNGYIWDSPAMISWRYKGMDKFGVWEQVWGDDLLIKTNYYAGEDRMEITGSRGIIWVTKCTAEFLDAPPLILYRDGRLTSFHDLDTDWQASFDAATQNFIDSILGKAEPELSFAEGYEVQRIAIAVKKSSDEKRVVSLDEVR
ncbi:MAG TPA: Gfo/Idh/MocA family oxidoreductase [bacterium]